MENIDNEQIVVAYRESKRAHKKAVTILLGLFVLFSIILSSVCFSDDELMILGFILIFMSAIFVGLIFMYKKKAEIIERVNKYPKTAMIIDGEYLCIVRDNIEKIKLTDIKKVRKANDIILTGVVTIRKSSGSITIVTNDKKYTVYQIINADSSSSAIKKFVKQAKNK